MKEDFTKADPQLKQIIAKESDTMFFEGKTLLAAACHLSVNDFQGCIESLVRSQELYLAYYIALAFHHDALKEIAVKLAERAERYFQVDVCLELLHTHVKDA